MTTPDTTAPQRRKRGRPRTFDAADVLDRSVNVFWRHGYHQVTTRDLEREIGISQSSIYNTFGSKEGLFRQVLERYQEQLGEQVLAQLERPNPDRQALLDFVDAVVSWVSDPEHPGCLILNFGNDSPEGRELLSTYRNRLRGLINPAVASFTADQEQVALRTELVTAAVLGISASARGGADGDEVRLLGAGVSQQIRSWHRPD
ncbi:MAG: TetR/AcrR family transcriptional regulator [Actinomycetota bacterium]